MAARTPQRHGTPMTVSFSHFRRPLHVMAAAVAALAVAGGPALAQSALPPELEAAVQAVQRADQADADQYAPQPLEAARQALAQAQAAHAARDKKDALDLALRASADADLARARSLEAVATAEVAQRKTEIADLQRQIGAEGER
ncbi:MAG TPA: DUF4398 domain-containing protein [Sphingobium sp.]|nr:DUF4398 domain-containing protein [Sphingobium sp.]